MERDYYFEKYGEPLPEPRHSSKIALRDNCRRNNIGRPGVDVNFITQSETAYRTGYFPVLVRFVGFELENSPEDVQSLLFDVCTDRKWKQARYLATMAKRSRQQGASTSRRDFDPEARRRILADTNIPRADRKALRAYFTDEC